MTNWLNSNPFQRNAIRAKKSTVSRTTQIPRDFTETDAKRIADRMTAAQYSKLVRLDGHFDRGGQELLAYLNEIGYQQPKRTLTWDDVEHVSRRIQRATGRG